MPVLSFTVELRRASPLTAAIAVCLDHGYFHRDEIRTLLRPYSDDQLADALAPLIEASVVEVDEETATVTYSDAFAVVVEASQFAWPFDGDLGDTWGFTRSVLRALEVPAPMERAVRLRPVVLDLPKGPRPTDR